MEIIRETSRRQRRNTSTRTHTDGKSCIIEKKTSDTRARHEVHVGFTKTAMNMRAPMPRTDGPEVDNGAGRYAI